jgi:hypothetical protein
LYWMNAMAGMRLQPGMIWLTIVPIALCGGPWCATAMLVIVVAVLPFSKTLVTVEERVALASFFQDSIATLAANWVNRAKPAESHHAT